MKKEAATYFAWMRMPLGQPIAQALKTLLETQHLYQHIDVTFPKFEDFYLQVKKPLIDNLGPRINEELVRELYNLSSKVSWNIVSPKAPKSRNFNFDIPSTEDRDIYIPSIEIFPQSIKVFCKTCDRVEAYNFIVGSDILTDMWPVLSDVQDHQVFVLNYQCQSCKGNPEVFMIRREEMKIAINGRSPMEVIPVDKDLPRNQNWLIRDALLAFYCQQTLPGLFCCGHF